jgi:hypothetical protein
MHTVSGNYLIQLCIWIAIKYDKNYNEIIKIILYITFYYLI